MQKLENSSDSVQFKKEKKKNVKYLRVRDRPHALQPSLRNFPSGDYETILMFA